MIRTLAAATLLFTAMPALAAPCTPAALAGLWTLVSIRAAEPGVEDFYAQAPHEVIRFGANGDLMYVASNRPYTPASARQALDQADAADGTTYRFTVRGERLELLRDGTSFQSFVCRVADRTEENARAGDLILTNVPERAALRRVQRRLR